MEDPIHHFEINVGDLKRSLRFYAEMLEWLGYRKTLDEKEVVGWRKDKTSIFLVQCEERFVSHGFHRKHVGLNHIAFRASSRNMVGIFYNDHLVPRRVRVL